mgnify:CR=1 FL=1
MILEDNISVTDLIISRTGSVDNLAQFIADNGLENVDQSLLGLDLEVYNSSIPFSEALRVSGRIVSTRDENSNEITLGGAFDGGFSDGFDN